MTFAEELAQTAAASKKAALATALHDPHIAILRNKCQKAAEAGKDFTVITSADLATRDGVTPNLERLAEYANKELGLSAFVRGSHIELGWTPTK